MQLKILEKYGGQWFESAPLLEMTWLRLKNTYARFMWFPSTNIQISAFIRDKVCDYFILGNGSNTILGNLDQVLIVTKNLNEISFIDNKVIVGAGVTNRKLVLESLSRNLGGIEFIYTIPGTIGGTVCMNGGAHLGEIGEHVQSVEAVSKLDGKIVTLYKDEIKFSYRYSSLLEEYIVTSVTLNLHPVVIDDIKQKIHEYQEYVNLKQPRAFTLGSTFKNPPSNRAWEILQRLPETELASDNFLFSPLHRNFLINTGDGTMKEAIQFINKVQKLIKIRYGLKLELELKWAGL